MVFLHFFTILADGYYIYIETSGKNPRNKARLISPQVPQSSTGNKCMTLWYYMYGQNVDSLNVYVQYSLTHPTSPYWNKRGTQGPRWNEASINIAASRPFNVSINNNWNILTNIAQSFLTAKLFISFMLSLSIKSWNNSNNAYHWAQ